jgi:hypothetical protein
VVVVVVGVVVEEIFFMKGTWTLIRLSDGKWSVRVGGQEVWILPILGYHKTEYTNAREYACEIERMLNGMGPV